MIMNSISVMLSMYPLQASTESGVDATHLREENVVGQCEKGFTAVAEKGFPSSMEENNMANVQLYHALLFAGAVSGAFIISHLLMVCYIMYHDLNGQVLGQQVLPMQHQQEDICTTRLKLFL